MKYKAKSMMSLNEMARLAIDYEGDGYVTGYPIVSGDDAYILNGVIEANEEYITINQWVPVFLESLQPDSPSLTDDQQVVLEWLKEETQKTDDCSFAVIHRFFTEKLHKRLPKNIYFSYLRLNDEQQFQVLAAFAEWGISGD